MSEELPDTEDDCLEPQLAEAIDALRTLEPDDAMIARVRIRALQRAPERPVRPPVVAATGGSQARRRRAIIGAVCAVLTLVAVVCFLLNPERQSAAAFADMVRRVESTRSLKLKIVFRSGDGFSGETRLYFSDHSIRMEDGRMISIADSVERKMLNLDPHSKQADLFELGDVPPKEFTNPADQIRRLKPEDAELVGEELVAGRRAHVFLLRNATFWNQTPQQMRLWVDRETNLPVKIVVPDSRPADPDYVPTEVSYEDLVWDQPLDPGLFSLKIPDGYHSGETELTTTGILSLKRAASHLLWSPDGSRLTALMVETCSDKHEFPPNRLIQWDARTGKRLWYEQIGDSKVFHGATGLAVTPDGNCCATVDALEVHLFNLASGERINAWAVDKRIASLAFSPDGKILAAGLAAAGLSQPDRPTPVEPGGVQFWDVESEELVRTLPATELVGMLSFSPDGKYLLSDCALWEVASGNVLATFPAESITAFSPDGSRFAHATGTEKVRIDLYEVAAQKPLKSLTYERTEREGAVGSLIFSLDGQRLISGDEHGSVRIWDFQTGKSELLYKIPQQADIWSLALSPDGATLAIGGNEHLCLVKLDGTPVEFEAEKAEAKSAERQLDAAEVTSLKEIRTLGGWGWSEDHRIHVSEGEPGSTGIVISFAGSRRKFGDESIPLLKPLKRLEVLDLRRTNVTDAGLKEICTLETLQALWLWDCPATEASLPELQNLKQLTALYLGESQVSDATLPLLTPVESLTELHLWGTGITDAGAKHFAEFKQLRELDLCEPALTDAGIADVCRIATLKKLELLSCRITEATVTALKSRPDLRLIVGGSDCKDEDLARLNGLPNLIELQLDDSQITDAGLLALKDLPSLQALSLGKTAITDAGLKSVGQFRKLRRLNLEHTPITDAGLNELRGLKKLSELTRTGTRITPEGFQNLKRALPNL